MNVKTYRTKSLEEALDHIKRDMGSEALVLSTREVAGSGPFNILRKPKWEVTAAGQPASAVAAPAPAAAPAAAAAYARTAGSAAAAVKMAPAVVTAPQRQPSKLAEPQGFEEEERPRARRATTVHDKRIDMLLEEMDELKRSLKNIGKSLPTRTEQGGGLYGELCSQGIDPDLADNLILSASHGNPAPSEMRNRVRRLLGEMLTLDPPAELHAKTRVISVFVGPTGSGKTTTIAKIAGQATMRFKKKVAVITTDMMRVGGQDQLSRYGALMGVPTFTCSDPTLLKDIIDSIEDADLILIDTPGASPSDLARLSRLEAAVKIPNARVSLVISATTRSEDITKIVKRFHKFGPRRAVITKVDETENRSGIIGDLLRNEIPVSYVSNGQRVPDDLLVPITSEMSKWVLPDV